MNFRPPMGGEMEHQKLAQMALEFLQDASVPMRSPVIENAQATRQWLAAIANGHLIVTTPSNPEEGPE